MPFDPPLLPQHLNLHVDELDLELTIPIFHQLINVEQMLLEYLGQLHEDNDSVHTSSLLHLPHIFFDSQLSLMCVSFPSVVVCSFAFDEVIEGLCFS